MNAFETVVATILEGEGFWVRTSYKVELSKEEKQQIGRATSPRWELDVVAYRPADNVLWVVECKSYLDSRGVAFKGLDPETGGTSRYKLFNEPKTREVVLDRLNHQLTEAGSIASDPQIILCLAAGKIVAADEAKIRNLFEENDWKLLDRKWITDGLSKLAENGYENSVASITAKLLKYIRVN